MGRADSLQKGFTAYTCTQPNFHKFTIVVCGNRPLKLAQRLNLAKPTLYQNWLTVEDITSMLSLADCEVIKKSQELLLPLPIWALAILSNRYIVKLWPFKYLALTNFIIARPQPRLRQGPKQPSVSVIVPAVTKLATFPKSSNVRHRWADGQNWFLSKGTHAITRMAPLKRRSRAP